MVLRFIIAIFSVGLLTGCVSKNTSLVSPEEFSKVRAMQAEARRLRAGDDIELGVEVNGKQEVKLVRIELGYNGSIPAPLIGDVDLNDLTLAEAREVLTTHYGRIFTTVPLITLRMADDRAAGEWGYVTVLGQVRNPGRYPVGTVAGMNLSDALHAAGGFGESANIKEVLVTRQAPDGALVQCKCDITRLGRAGSGELDLVLFDGDIVQVPERLF